ncbi:hypothetical protein QNA08_05995 [Chelatococcus sp. SYSU_G07232]|uniref:DUF2946 domain-containing protein n=1 Tax=Chelatococcus albus TaxID=3047466 RepID=A0ABT7AGL4_9HYPH|nr:hypothetical protein [Chelatococcus sp. SYSU_G07232]MDJ1157781.1 hypothetical protein [Chelatococcus sp. SYSU_G07232]
MQKTTLILGALVAMVLAALVVVLGGESMARMPLAGHVHGATAAAVDCSGGKVDPAAGRHEDGVRHGDGSACCGTSACHFFAELFGEAPLTLAREQRERGPLLLSMLPIGLPFELDRPPRSRLRG